MIDFQYLWIRNYESPRTIATHKHNCYELICYLKGSGVGTFGDSTYTYEAGSAAIIAPDTPHGETHSELTSMISVGFTLTDFYSPITSCFFPNANTALFDYFQDARHEFKQKKPYFKRKIECLIEILLIEIIRMNSPAAEDKKNSIDYAVSYINEYYMANLDLPQLAKSAGYCEDHFRKIFKEKTGMSPKTYILETRLNAAKKLLADPACDLTSIAGKCGYEYYSQFSLFFKKQTGLSPSEYRKEILGAEEE